METTVTEVIFMNKIVDLKSVARPINLENRQEKLDKRRKEIVEKHEYLRKKAKDILNK